MSVVNDPKLCFCEETDDSASDAMLRDALMDQYANLQRIKHAPDREKEIEYQIRIAKEKLKLLGFDAEELDIGSC